MFSDREIIPGEVVRIRPPQWDFRDREIIHCEVVRIRPPHTKKIKTLS